MQRVALIGHRRISSRQFLIGFGLDVRVGVARLTRVTTRFCIKINTEKVLQ
jgi:hypothetical protein